MASTFCRTKSLISDWRKGVKANQYMRPSIDLLEHVRLQDVQHLYTLKSFFIVETIRPSSNRNVLLQSGVDACADMKCIGKQLILSQ